MEEKLDWVYFVGQGGGGDSEKKWIKEGKAAGECLGVMMDGLHSVSQSLSVINRAEVEIWGWCIHKAHGPAL